MFKSIKNIYNVLFLIFMNYAKIKKAGSIDYVLCCLVLGFLLQCCIFFPHEFYAMLNRKYFIEIRYGHNIISNMLNYSIYIFTLLNMWYFRRHNKYKKMLKLCNLTNKKKSYTKTFILIFSFVLCYPLFAIITRIIYFDLY